jgi:hypothetical protein
MKRIGSAVPLLGTARARARAKARARARDFRMACLSRTVDRGGAS